MKSEMAIIEQEVRTLFGMTEPARPDTAMAALEGYVGENQDVGLSGVASYVPVDGQPDLLYVRVPMAYASRTPVTYAGEIVGHVRAAGEAVVYRQWDSVQVQTKIDKLIQNVEDGKVTARPTGQSVELVTV